MWDHWFLLPKRRVLTRRLQSVHPSTMKDSPAQRAGRAAFHAHMIKKLAKKPWIADYRKGIALSVLRHLTERT